MLYTPYYSPKPSEGNGENAESTASSPVSTTEEKSTDELSLEESEDDFQQESEGNSDDYVKPKSLAEVTVNTKTEDIIPFLSKSLANGRNKGKCKISEHAPVVYAHYKSSTEGFTVLCLIQQNPLIGDENDFFFSQEGVKHVRTLRTASDKMSAKFPVGHVMANWSIATTEWFEDEELGLVPWTNSAGVQQSPITNPTTGEVKEKYNPISGSMEPCYRDTELLAITNPNCVDTIQADSAPKGVEEETQVVDKEPITFE